MRFDCSIIDDTNYAIFKAGDGKRPVGVLLLDKRTGEILSCFIETDYRRKNIATLLINEAEKMAHNLGLKPWARVTIQNLESQKLWEKLGYKKMVMYEKK